MAFPQELTLLPYGAGGVHWAKTSILQKRQRMANVTKVMTRSGLFIDIIVFRIAHQDTTGNHFSPVMDMRHVYECSYKR
jgi:hypothetical protein